jgi:hypothetical protein
LFLQPRDGVVKILGPIVDGSVSEWDVPLILDDLRVCGDGQADQENEFSEMTAKPLPSVAARKRNAAYTEPRPQGAGSSEPEIHKEFPQNVILVPSWINLGLLIWLVITPKLEFVTVVFGVPK